MAIPKHISTIVAEAAAAPTKQEKIQILRRYDHPALRGYLYMTIDPRCKWLLPEGSRPFAPCKEVDTENALYNEYRRMYIFLEGGNPNLTAARREQLFFSLLESLDPKDAQFLIDVKDHKLPQGLDEQIIKEAFPKL